MTGATRAIRRIPVRQFEKRQRKAKEEKMKIERMQKEVERLRAKLFVMNEDIETFKLRIQELLDENRMLRGVLGRNKLEIQPEVMKCAAES